MKDKKRMDEPCNTDQHEQRTQNTTHTQRPLELSHWVLVTVRSFQTRFGGPLWPFEISVPEQTPNLAQILPNSWLEHPGTTLVVTNLSRSMERDRH